MSRRITHDEVEALLGAYALHAVDPDEAALVESHLQECPKCRAEVAGHREVAALLGNSGGDAPEGLWDRIASTLEESPPPLRLALSNPQADAISLLPRRRRVGNHVVVAAMSAAAALLIGALGVKVVRQEDQIARVQEALSDDAVLEAANVALLHPEAARTTLASPDGTFHVEAVLLPDGNGYLMAEDLPSLDPGRAYQLWGQTGGGMISLGLLGADPDGVVPFRVTGDVAALAISDEVATGVNEPSSPPLLLGRFA